jgi:hypothetical protein
VILLPAGEIYILGEKGLTFIFTVRRLSGAPGGACGRKGGESRRFFPVFGKLSSQKGGHFK